MDSRRAAFGRLRDAALVVAFLALSAIAYGVLFADADEVMTARVQSQFSDVYRPGQSLWTGVVIAPAPPQGYR